jgi:aconitase A
VPDSHSGGDGQPVYLRDLRPTEAEIAAVIDTCLQADMFARDYADVFTGDERRKGLPVPQSETFRWDEESTYVRRPPYFEDMKLDPEPVSDISGARVLAKLGGLVTTDHISPAGAVQASSPAGKYLAEPCSGYFWYWLQFVAPGTDDLTVLARVDQLQSPGARLLRPVRTWWSGRYRVSS